MTPDQPAELIDYTHALTRTTTHHEPYSEPHTNGDGSTTWVHLRHRTTNPPLLAQLASAIAQSGSAEGGRRVFESKPSARLEALDALAGIENDTYTELGRLGVKHPPPHLVAAVSKLGALAVGRLCDAPRGKRNTDDDHPGWCCDGHRLESVLRGWWAHARVVTGWDSPAWRPSNTCPLCNTKGSLRVRLDAHTAVCVDCRETWTADTIGLLADHIRSENDDVAAPQAEAS